VGFHHILPQLGEIKPGNQERIEDLYFQPYAIVAIICHFDGEKTQFQA